MSKGPEVRQPWRATPAIAGYEGPSPTHPKPRWLIWTMLAQSRKRTLDQASPVQLWIKWCGVVLLSALCTPNSSTYIIWRLPRLLCPPRWVGPGLNPRQSIHICHMSEIEIQSYPTHISPSSCAILLLSSSPTVPADRPNACPHRRVTLPRHFVPLRMQGTPQPNHAPPRPCQPLQARYPQRLMGPDGPQAVGRPASPRPSTPPLVDDMARASESRGLAALQGLADALDALE